jgi:predicted permease
MRQFLELLLQDLRFGFRVLAKSPGATAVAVLTLALGAGANTALFSVIKGVLLEPLPFPEPDRLVALYQNEPHFTHGSISYPNFLDWQRSNHSFSAMAAHRPTGFTLTGNGHGERVDGEMVSAQLFPMLGVRPAKGRLFTVTDDRLGAAPVALISDSFWHRKLGAAPDVVGGSLALDGRAYTVVGIVPASFHLTIMNFPDGIEIYVPVGQWDWPEFRDRSTGAGMDAIGRLKPGVTLAQARADMAAITRSLAATYPATDLGVSATLIPLKEEMVGNIQPYLLMLSGAVCFVLLIACVNVANLLLARSTGRAREFAVRAALGASQGRVIRQLLTESLLIGLAGGGLGLLLAGWGTRAALAALPAALPRAESIGLDWGVLLFTLALSIAASIGFGLAPALRTSQPDLQPALKEGGRGGTGSRQRAQSALVVTEVAMALVLLAGAGLMIRSLEALLRADPGFDARRVVTFRVALPPTPQAAGDAAVQAAWRRLHERLASLPGVEAVSLSAGTRLLKSDDERLFWIAGRPRPASISEMSWTLFYAVEPEYFKAMGIRLLRGRLLAPQDDERAPHVVVIDESFAGRFFPNQDPIGKRIEFREFPGVARIVGIVGHVMQWGVDLDATYPMQEQLYYPLLQLPKPAQSGAALHLDAMVLAAGDPRALIGEIRRAAAGINPDEVVFGADTMEGVISQSLAARRFTMILLAVFAGLAVVLASVGIYGVLSYVVGQRTQELGIRMALGARRVEVLGQVLGQGARLALAGIALGLVAALGLTRLMTGLLIGVRPADPATFAAVAVLLCAVALAACYVPARRAMGIDPMVALRAE